MRGKSSTLCLGKSWWTGDWSNIQTATRGAMASLGDTKLPIRPWDLPVLPTQGEALGLSPYTAVQHKFAIRHKDHATHWSTEPTATGLHAPKQKQCSLIIQTTADTASSKFLLQSADRILTPEHKGYPFNIAYRHFVFRFYYFFCHYPYLTDAVLTVKSSLMFLFELSSLLQMLLEASFSSASQAKIHLYCFKCWEISTLAVQHSWVQAHLQPAQSSFSDTAVPSSPSAAATQGTATLNMELQLRQDRRSYCLLTAYLPAHPCAYRWTHDSCVQSTPAKFWVPFTSNVMNLY